MTNFNDIEEKWLEENTDKDSDKQYGGLFDINLTDKVVKKFLKQVNLEQEHIDKAREVIDMLEFTKEDGKDVIYVNVGDNVQVKIVR